MSKDIYADPDRDFTRFPSLCKLHPRSKLLSLEGNIIISQAEWQKLQRRHDQLVGEKNAAKRKLKTAEERLDRLEKERKLADQELSQFKEEVRAQKQRWYHNRIWTSFTLSILWLLLLFWGNDEDVLRSLLLVGGGVLAYVFWIAEINESDDHMACTLIWLIQILCFLGVAACEILWAVLERDSLGQAAVYICAGSFVLEGVRACIQRWGKNRK